MSLASRKKQNKGVYFLNTLPSIQKIKKYIKSPFVIVICDQKLKNKLDFKNHSPLCFVKAGEKLKDIDYFSSHFKKILRSISKKSNNWNEEKAVFLGIGGGSVSDFTGFLSGVYKRGRDVWFMPSTPLCALDAAHGGKTALNVSSIKNLLGLYHFPKGVLIVRELISEVSQKELLSAFGELVKISLIQGGSFYQDLKKCLSPSFNVFWRFLPLGVNAKLKIVSSDLFEKRKKRRLLNFGHTVGHIFESYHKEAHGKAVAQGMIFSLKMGLENKIISHKSYQEIISMIQNLTRAKGLPKVPLNIFKQLLRQDKKCISSSEIEFVFLKSPGKAFVKKVFINDVVLFYKQLMKKRSV